MKLLTTDKTRDAYLRRTYGLGLDDYNKILEEQGGVCAICSKTPEEEGRNLAVDHNHKTGEVRGLLCAHCNHRKIGRHTDADLLQKMADYLRRRTGFFAPPKTKKRRTRASRKKNN